MYHSHLAAQLHAAAPFPAQFATTSHKMMYGHYLQKKGEHISKFCVAPTKLKADYPEFVAALEARWDTLMSKRTIKVDDLNSKAKKQRAMSFGESAESVCSHGEEGHHSVVSGSTAGSSRISYAFLAPDQKQRLRDECQTAWDLAFVVCGITFATADHPLFRAAIQKTRCIPDFSIACTKTMRTSRLIKLDERANEYKEMRLRAGEKFGFAITSDGWRSVAKKNYHNYILISVEGPIFVSLIEVTGAEAGGDAIKDDFNAQFAKLGPEITRHILVGITDTPSANRRAWRLLEAEHPRQFWIGCATHEVSLLFKEWIKKIDEIHILFKEGHRIVKWINNHAALLKEFRALVPAHFSDKRKHTIGLYSPADTRMATVFKMLYRLQVLQPVLSDLVSRPEYEVASQAALKRWSDAQPAGAKLVQVNGKYHDKVKHYIQEATFWGRIDVFIHATKSTMYLLRLVDGQSPVLGKFYYCCALVDKHLRVLKEAGNVPYIDAMRSIFQKRWKRWHRPLHTFAYAVDPCYQAHELNAEERSDCLKVHVCACCPPYTRPQFESGGAYQCLQVIKKLGGADWPALKVEFDRWRTAGQSIFAKEVWEAADKHHGYQCGGTRSVTTSVA